MFSLLLANYICVTMCKVKEGEGLEYFHHVTCGTSLCIMCNTNCVLFMGMTSSVPRITRDENLPGLLPTSHMVQRSYVYNLQGGSRSGIEAPTASIICTPATYHCSHILNPAHETTNSVQKCKNPITIATRVNYTPCFSPLSTALYRPSWSLPM